MPNTVAALLSEIERVSFAPSNQVTFSTPDILAIADEVIESQMQPKIILVREGYFVKIEAYTITVDQARYELPDRAAAMGFREIKIIDSDNSNNSMDLIYADFSDIRTTNSGEPKYFYLEENSVVLYPTPNATRGTLQVWYPIRPNKLVEVSATGKISAINTVTKTLTLESMPSTWVGTDKYDLIKGTGAHELRNFSDAPALSYFYNTPSFFNLPTLEIAWNVLPTDLVIGDYVALAQETPLVQLPSIFIRVLARGVAAEMIGDMNQPAAKLLLERFDKGMENALNLITPRVPGAPKYLVNENW